MNMVVRDNLLQIAKDTSDQDIYRVAAQFLLTKEVLKNTIGSLSEGQK
jgi:ATPase subunit of ABC transporter with duplicated ATPase domains